MTSYFGVIGNRDYIKIQGQRRPFWEFLDVQPAGWLCSLAYKRMDTPEAPTIWDCGAWSYKTEPVPRLGRDLVTPVWAAGQYVTCAHPGDFVVAPDHMLIPWPDIDIESRRHFNRESALAFAKICPFHLRPMAVVHGLDLTERTLNARFLISTGYQALALGGLAGQASKRQMILDTVGVIRREFPNVWLHVLGLSSPAYAAEWRRLGVDSFDGASYFKQAFTAGKFFVEQDGALVSYQAARPGEPVTAPACGCLSCSRLRAEGVDTRSYGSNEHNMGRAAHNLNQLLKTFKLTRKGSRTLNRTYF